MQTDLYTAELNARTLREERLREAERGRLVRLAEGPGTTARAPRPRAVVFFGRTRHAVHKGG